MLVRCRTCLSSSTSTLKEVFSISLRTLSLQTNKSKANNQSLKKLSLKIGMRCLKSNLINQSLPLMFPRPVQPSLNSGINISLTSTQINLELIQTSHLAPNPIHSRVIATKSLRVKRDHQSLHRQVNQSLTILPIQLKTTNRSNRLTLVRSWEVSVLISGMKTGIKQSKSNLLFQISLKESRL